MHLTRAVRRRPVELIHLCDSHSKEHFSDRYKDYLSTIGSGRPLRTRGGVAFDVDFLFWDERQDPRPWGRCHVELLEVGGRRRFGFTIGVFEWDALDCALHGCLTAQPSTHRATVDAMEKLSGRLRHVEIDAFFPEMQTYKAKLVVQHATKTVSLDVRPSDALVLATICDVSIEVSNDVLRSFATL
jgi:bifunctional DNase/RNase